ncbi:MAG: hypothetical protein RBT59_10525 [Arcobacteraceae bacterium]|jgi:hypothetical protein|nr:hypothetical protein [Arcobacteraceae bacterium]
MTANDFGKTLSFVLNDKDKKFWSEPELFINLQRAYREIQKELPCFISNENIDIKEGIELYQLKFTAIKNIYLYINGIKYNFEEIQYLNENYNENIYSLSQKQILINKTPLKDGIGKIRYFYLKELENENDYITTPLDYEEALRLLTLSYIFEKSPKDATKRDLSIHYLKRYNDKVVLLKDKKQIKKNIKSKYQRI